MSEKVWYVSSAKIPGKMANSIQQVEMCEAFSKVGNQVHLVHPSYRSLYSASTWNDIKQYYGIKKEFSVTTVPSLNGSSVRPPQAKVVSMMSTIAGWLVMRTLKGDLKAEDTVYGRSYYPMFVYNEFRKRLPKERRPKLIFEIHEPISAHMKQRFYSSVDHIISITERLKKYMVQTFGISSSKITVEPDGVNYEPYKNISKEEARKEVKIDTEEKVVMYTGHLYPGKGVTTLVEAAKQMDAAVYIVGGYQSDIERVKEQVGTPENVTYVGFVDPSMIPKYQIAADILVAPYTEESRPWVSPLKIFEYMAAGRPIVASDRKVLAEVLTHRENALIFEKSNPDRLSQRVIELLENKTLYYHISQKLQQDIQEYRWEERARRITTLIDKL